MLTGFTKKYTKTIDVYDYEQVVYDDMIKAIREYLELHPVDFRDADVVEQARDSCMDYVYMDDDVTGNMSGVYAACIRDIDPKDCLIGNWEYVIDMCEDYGYTMRDLAGWIDAGGYEGIDVRLRCWMVDQMYCQAWEEVTGL